MKLAEIYNKQQNKKPMQNISKKPVENEPKKTKNIFLHLPEVGQLVKHLEVLYSSMIIQNMNRSNEGSMWDKISWYNPGQGSVKQSDSVN